MKVVLRNPNAPDGRQHWSLTVGCDYEVLGIECDDYRLLDDTGKPFVFDAVCFQITDPQEPAFWVSEVGEEGERYAYPPGWGVVGFFEAWHDGVEIVRRVFTEQLRAWYPETAQGRRIKRCT